MRVGEFKVADRARWDAYVNAHPEGTVFHLSGWEEVLRRSFKHETFYLYAEANGEIVGVLPLAQVASVLFGKALISTPFCVYGGVVASSPEAQLALEEAASELARKLRVDYLEMRNRKPARADWIRKELYVTFRKRLFPEVEKNLNAIPRKQRAMIRKGAAAGLTTAIDTDTRRLYDVYSQSVHGLGTPVFSRRYMDVLQEVFGPACEIQTIERSGTAVASVMSFYFRDEVLPYYGGGTPAARECAGNDFMYGELMRRATERGVGLFDFGRSKRETGAFRFKEHWGFEPEPLAYEYLLVGAKAMPNLSPTNPKYKLVIDTWKRLPLGVTRIVGPPLARYLG